MLPDQHSVHLSYLRCIYSCTVPVSCSTPKVLCHSRSIQSFALLFIPDEILQPPFESYLAPLFFAHRLWVLTGCPAPQQKKAKSPSLKLLLCPQTSKVLLFIALSYSSNPLKYLLSKFFSFLPALIFLWHSIYLHPSEDSCKHINLSLPSSLQFLVRKCAWKHILINSLMPVHLLLFCIFNSFFLYI